MMADPFTITFPEDESLQRGRKRRRTSDDVTLQSVGQNPSGESTTLRGRGRRRSASGATSQSDSTSKPRTQPMSSPGWKYQKNVLPRELAQKKRSQSPSRSRSKDGDRTPRRRRQRTTSRSRSHGAGKFDKRGLKREESDHKTHLSVERGSKYELREI